MHSHLESMAVGPEGQTVIMDIHGCPYTLSEMMGFIAIAQERVPLHEVFLDGDEYAIVARAKGVSS